MRNGTYRGKRKDTGEWVIGAWFHCPEGEDFIATGFLLDDEPGVASMCATYEVDPDTIGEYSGVDDANGNPVYEGDILRDLISGEAFLVRYDEDSFQWRARHKRDGRWEDDSLLYVYAIAPVLEGIRSVVIGNIYDDPEMNREYWFPKEDGAF